jgi:glycosyltransferase involved in cell wall biosynthesis
MRVTVYCPHYEDAGGVREAVRRLNRHMAARGHRLAVVTRAPVKPRQPPPDADPESGGPILRTRAIGVPTPARGPRAYFRFGYTLPVRTFQVLRAVRHTAPDLIAAHCTKFHAPYVLALRLTVRAPIVVHLHNGPQTADGPASPRLQRLLARCATRVIAVSEGVAEWARGCCPARADRVVTVPNGTDADSFTDAPPARRARPYVLGVGGLAIRKGFDLLIDALAASRTDLDLVLAGDGPERAALAARSRRVGLAGRVHFLGHVERSTVASLMRGAAMVAVPSRFEGFSLVCREAMAAGAPLVASALPVFPTELRHDQTGLLVPPEDVGALAAALHALATDPVRALSLGAAARAAARGFPGWDEVTERVLAEYARALGWNGRAPADAPRNSAANSAALPG